jgi:hypothetical protein
MANCHAVHVDSCALNYPMDTVYCCNAVRMSFHQRWNLFSCEVPAGFTLPIDVAFGSSLKFLLQEVMAVGQFEMTFSFYFLFLLIRQSVEEKQRLKEHHV